MIGWFNAQKKYVDRHMALYKPQSAAAAAAAAAAADGDSGGGGGGGGGGVLPPLEGGAGWDVVWFPVPAYTCLVPYGAYRLAEKVLGVLELL
jgi:hypothetical protein